MHFELDGAGLIPSEEDSPHHPPQPIHEYPINKNLLRPTLWRSMSRSDPHLNLTTLFHHPEDKPLTNVVTGLLEASAVVSDPYHYMTSQPNKTLLSSVKEPTLAGSASSAALLDSNIYSSGAPLRKSSSAVDWTLLTDLSKDKDTFQQLAERPGAFLEGAKKKPTNHHHFGFGALPLLGTHREEGGLVMNTSTSSSSAAPSTVDHRTSTGMFSGLTSSHNTGSCSLLAAASAALQGTSSSSALSGSVVPSTQGHTNPLLPSTSTASLPSTTHGLNPADIAIAHGEQSHAAASQQEHKHGMLGSVFNRGFLGRPVVRSEEENYRYIMALDR